MAFKTCAVCYEDLPENKFVTLPCCHTENSSLHYCKECLIIICTRSNGKYGRCPTCSSFLVYDKKKDEVIKAEGVAQCRICSQNRLILDKARRLCDACFLGIHYPLRYECEGCHRYSRIPHPMWRYQENKDAFTRDTWFCRGCLNQTHWRVYVDDIPRIPADDLPESWGARNDFLQQIRDERNLRIRNRRRNNNFLNLLMVFVIGVALAKEFQFL